jgi:hypothetical protein
VRMDQFIPNYPEIEARISFGQRTDKCTIAL